MNFTIFDPLEEYGTKFEKLHSDNTNEFFDDLVKKSGIDIEENRKTVKEYNEFKENSKKTKKKLNLYRFLRVVMIITLILIPLVILKTTPKIRKIREELATVDQKTQELLEAARRQMAPLNRLFSENDSITITEKTVPALKFDSCFTAKAEEEMRQNYDLVFSSEEESALDVLSGEYNGNPFFFENRKVHTMGTQTYYGSKHITWTETYTDSEGHRRTRTRSETLTASVTKPKPFYTTQAILNYGSQGAAELCFSRQAGHHEQKSEKELEKFVKKGEKRLKKMTDKALQNNDDFVSMSNGDFEVLFGALDRTNEVQFRTMFTPLAQTNMVKLLCSTDGYGDDFVFIKSKRMNKIVSEHSQGRLLKIYPNSYRTFSYDETERLFKDKNKEFFKALYFDFAPILAIPMYQETPVDSLKPLPDYGRLYSYKECETLANTVDPHCFVHENTKTEAILKTGFIESCGGIDQYHITAFSYDIINRVDIIPVYGGDGRYHDVEVFWDDYIPLVNTGNFSVADAKIAKGNILAAKDGLCIFN